MVWRVANKAADSLSRVDYPSIIRAEGDGVRDVEILAIAVFAEPYFVFSYSVPDSEFIYWFNGMNDITVPL